MNTPQLKFLLTLLTLGLAAPQLLGQTFNSGSLGSYGPINVTTTDVTLDVPPDGVFHCTTISVSANRTLRFKANARNTPVYLLATGEVTVAGRIDLDGERANSVSGGLPGPGGFAGGNPASVGSAPGDGRGPGAGRAGTRTTTADGAGGGAFSTRVTSGNSLRAGNPYGSALLLPLIGGSGGGGAEGTPGVGGGGGGGALLIASNTRITLTGTLQAEGASYLSGAFNSGSGGAIRLVAPIVSGNGSIYVRGGEGNVTGGAGRIRIDTLDRSQLSFNLVPEAVASLGSMMVVFPTPMPRLDVIEAAGTTIADGSGPVLVTLPFGAPAGQTIKIRARDFGQAVPIRITLTPDHGASKSYEAEIPNGTANPAETTVTVDFPLNAQTAVEVWTR